MSSPIDRLIDKAVRCTICGQPMGCACWTKCACGWSYRTGESCRNPNCSTTKKRRSRARPRHK